MRIVSNNISVEVFDNIENDSFVDIPFYVNRTESEHVINWFGLNTNWKYIKSEKTWYKLKGSDFVKSDIPEYEKMYQKAIRNKKIDILLTNKE